MLNRLKILGVLLLASGAGSIGAEQPYAFTTIPGVAELSGAMDGPAKSARFSELTGIAVEPWQASPSAVDPSFYPGAGGDGEVHKIVIQLDGRILAAGKFHQMNGRSRNGIARLNSDGTLDTGFDPGVGFEGPGLPQGDIQFMAVQADGKIWVGGEFTNFDGFPVPGFVKLNADGSRDTSFVFPIGVRGLLAVREDGKIMTEEPVLRLKADGTIDQSFQAPPDLIPAEHTTRAYPTSDGKTLIVTYLSPGGESFWGSDPIITPIRSNGSVDDTWQGNFVLPYFSEPWRDPVILQTPENRWLAGWGPYLGRFEPDGSVDSTFSPDRFAFQILGLNYSFGVGVWATALQADGKILVGGTFNGVMATKNPGLYKAGVVVRLNPDGSFESGFGSVNTDVDYSDTGNPKEFPIVAIRAMAVQSDGRIVIGGAFNKVNGLTRHKITRLLGGEQAGPPKFTQEPAATAAFVGESVTFFGRAVGNPAPTLQWQFNGQPIAGETNETLLLNPARLENAGDYALIASNSFGAVKALAKLKIVASELPVIVAQPVDQTVNAGTSAFISVAVTNASSVSPSYQWQFNGTLLAGATNATLHFEPVRLASAGSYFVIISNLAGSVASLPVTLTVRGTAPSITTQPQHKTLFAGTNWLLSVTAEGTPPIRYQWRKNGIDLEGQTSADLRISSWETEDQGYYSVVAQNDGGSVTSSNAAVSVNVPYTFTTMAGLAGIPGSADGRGPDARFNQPYGLALDVRGNLYVVDGRNATIRRISVDGTVTTVAGQAGSATEPRDGPAPDGRLYNPYGICIDLVGNLLVTEDNRRLRQVDPAGTISTFPDLAAHNVSIDSLGNLFVIAPGSIRKITPDRSMTTVANLGADGIACGKNGAIYLSYSYVIKKLGPDGTAALLAGGAEPGTRDGPGTAARFAFPAFLALDDEEAIYMTDLSHIRKMTPDGIVSTIAGGGRGSADGIGLEARFNSPSGIVVDSARNIYVADTLNHTIRKGIPRFRLQPKVNWKERAVYLQFPSRAGINYRFEASANLIEWKVALRTNASGTNIFLRDALPASQGKLFYRAVQE